jgi:hypothetical protein
MSISMFYAGKLIDHTGAGRAIALAGMLLATACPACMPVNRYLPLSC